MITLESIAIPSLGDLHWADEIEWTPVMQGTEFSTTGALLVDLSVKQAGRPITLVGGEQMAWITRATLLELQALAADPGREMALVLHDRTFTVIFSHDGKPIEAEPIMRIVPPLDTDIYVLSAVRFLALAETT